MNVSCPQCSTVYRVDPAKVPQGGVRARCSTCSGVIPVGITAPQAARRPTPADAFASAFSAPRPAAPGPFVHDKARQSTPAYPATPVGEARSRSTPVRPTPPQAAPVRSTPVRSTPVRPQPGAPQATLGASLAPMRTTPKSDWPSIATPAASTPVPISVPPVTPPAPSQPVPVAQPTVSQSPDAAPASRRPINPFLARDPSLRAKRLARALVSDMVAYYPAKHSEGLDKGTLKELFRDEIKKSYDEYVAQVGADFARTTTHFQESLNEVLGAGKKIF